MSEIPNDPETSAKREEIDNTLEDALGVNFRALKTLKDILLRPAVVFASYAADDRVTYTPAIRLFVGLIAVQIFTSVIWGGYAGLLLSQWASMPAQSVQNIEALFGGPLLVLAEHYGNAAPFLHATVVGAFTALSAFLIGAFNKSLSWVARLNITFGILTGGTVIGLALMLVAALTDHMESISWAPLVIFLAYWLFFVRGAPGTLASTTMGAYGKGLIFSFVTMIYVILGGLVMALLAFTYAYLMINYWGGGG